MARPMTFLQGELTTLLQGHGCYFPIPRPQPLREADIPSRNAEQMPFTPCFNRSERLRAIRLFAFFVDITDLLT